MGGAQWRGGGGASFVLKPESVSLRAAFSCCVSRFSRAAGLRSQREVRQGGEEGTEGGSELLQTSLKVGGADVAPPQGAVDVLLEEPPVCLQNLCCLLVQRVLRVWLLEGGGGRSRQLIYSVYNNYFTSDKSKPEPEPVWVQQNV